MKTEYVRLHEGFATDLGLELKANEDARKPGMKPQKFRCFVHAPKGFNMLKPTPNDAGMPSAHVSWLAAWCCNDATQPQVS